ncbi:MAG: hypothetical protein Q3980_04050 [Turicibacter sp.]|nr:hypothetical protein [Turicibacter sp.]
MKFIYFDNKHVNKDAIHYLEKGKSVYGGYRIYLVLGSDDYFLEEIFKTEDEANERYCEILNCLNDE